MKNFFILIVLIFTISCKSQEITITAKPGEEYVLPKINRNIKINIKGTGSKDAPFVLRGVKGGSQILGDSFIKILDNSSYIIINNLQLINNEINYNSSTALIEVGIPQNQNINNITIENIVITNNSKISTIETESQFHWINVNASNVTINNIICENKQNRLPIIHIGANYSGNKIINSVFKNVKAREGEALEAIRVGLTIGESDIIIQNNEFINYYGDSETISIKASKPKIIGNKFIDCRSGVSIRYGNSVTVKNNIFNNVAHAVRISGKEHIIENNSFYNTKSRYITFMGGGKNYPRAENIIIRNNNFQDKFILYVIDHTINILPPKNITFENNYINGILLENKIKNFEKKRKLIKNSSGIKSYQVEY